MGYFKNILVIFLLLFGINSIGQIIGTNLVNNPSFEEYYNCPVNAGQLNESKYWWGFSADYYNSCTTVPQLSIPSNFAGFQYAHTGNAYTGLIIFAKTIYYSDNREKILSGLKNKPVINCPCGSTYKCSPLRHVETKIHQKYILSQK